MAEKLVIYDSIFGNTAKIAKAIGEALGDADVKKVTEVTPPDLDDLKVLFVGSPTRGFNPTPDIKNFLKGLNKGALNGIKAAAFDTRIPYENADPAFLRLMIRWFGYADEKMIKQLSRAGADLAIDSEGFGVKDSEGPLIDGEIERAKAWAVRIL